MAVQGIIKKEQRHLFEKIFEEVRLMARPPSPLIADLFGGFLPPSSSSGKGSAAVSGAPVRLVSGGHSSASNGGGLVVKLTGGLDEDLEEPHVERKRNSKTVGRRGLVPPIQGVRGASLLNRTLILR
jgi:hypothetical protein